MSKEEHIKVTSEQAEAIATKQHDRSMSVEGVRLVTRKQWIENRAWELRKYGARPEELVEVEQSDGSAS